MIERSIEQKTPGELKAEAENLMKEALRLEKELQEQTVKGGKGKELTHTYVKGEFDAVHKKLDEMLDKMDKIFDLAQGTKEPMPQNKEFHEPANPYVMSKEDPFSDEPPAFSYKGGSQKKDNKRNYLIGGVIAVVVIIVLAIVIG